MALLQRQQSFQQHHQMKDAVDDARRPSVATKAPHPGTSTTTTTTGGGRGGGGGGGGGGGSERERGVRRASSFMGLTGPKTAASTTSTATGTAASGGTTSATHQGPSLFGVLASKRLAKRFASRFHRRRLGTLSSLMSSGGGGVALPVMTEPTYRMEPYRKFRPSEVEKMLKSLLEEKMDKFRYSARICANMCKILGDDIKDKVKQMDFDRYKIVSNVVIGQKKDQAVITCSRCAWDDKLDSFASYTFQNEHIFCTATVFGIYME